MAIASKNVDFNELEAILMEAQYGPVTCSFCHKAVGDTKGHVLSVQQHQLTGQIEQVLATCDACNEVFGEFQKALALGIRGHIEEMFAPLGSGDWEI